MIKKWEINFLYDKEINNGTTIEQWGNYESTDGTRVGNGDIAHHME